MKTYAIVLNETEAMELQGILMDRDGKAALRISDFGLPPTHHSPLTNHK